jgi:hypothetical protein
MNGSSAAAIAVALDSVVKKMIARLPERSEFSWFDIFWYPFMLRTSSVTAGSLTFQPTDSRYEVTGQYLGHRAVCQNDRAAG